MRQHNAEEGRSEPLAVANPMSSSILTANLTASTSSPKVLQTQIKELQRPHSNFLPCSMTMWDWVGERLCSSLPLQHCCPHGTCTALYLL
mmetsp:Transcript_5076/g.11028  ORF Transcript_5076/g.11028 Transcript_5076/m.11028 type:complete len:90 (+) Transcript_5076:152-421(+)